MSRFGSTARSLRGGRGATRALKPRDCCSWGDEAFETARRLGRPIPLPVGYSTCHWCHVMEEESFEQDLTRARNDYVAVVAEYDKAQCTLLRAIGGIRPDSVPVP